VAVESIEPNLVLLNNQRVGEISPGEDQNGQSWTNCEGLCSRGLTGNCTELTGDLLDRFGAYDEVSLCGTDIANNGEGIKSGDAMNYEWESPVREFHETDGIGEVGAVPKDLLKDLLVGTGTETLEWRLNYTAGEDANPGYSPLLTKFYGPAEDVTARFQGEYCLIYTYDWNGSSESESGDDSESESE